VNNENFAKSLLDNLTEGAYFVEPDRTIAYWNKAAETITGFTAAEVVGRHCWDNILRHVDDTGEQLCFTICPLAKTMLDGKTRQAEVYLHHKKGYRLPVLVRCSPVKDSEGRIIGGIEIFSDNSPKRAIDKRNRELEKMALMDPLTKIGNRRSLINAITERLSELRRYDRPFGVLFIDIDHFKPINDIYGHRVGDQVLKMVADTLKFNIRASDTLGRWGGEEFVLITANADGKTLYALAEKLRNLAKTSGLRRTNRATIRATISIGACSARAEDNEDTLVSRADRLMYLSKRHGRDRVSTDLGSAA